MTTTTTAPDLSARVQYLAGVLSQAGVASTLSVSRSSVSRWAKGDDVPRGANATAVVDLDFLVSRYALTYPATTFPGWFQAPNPFLNGASPADVLGLEGPGRVIDALTSEASGSYA